MLSIHEEKHLFQISFLPNRNTMLVHSISPHTPTGHYNFRPSAVLLSQQTVTCSVSPSTFIRDTFNRIIITLNHMNLRIKYISNTPKSRGNTCLTAVTYNLLISIPNQYTSIDINTNLSF
jgi:hypothetical protein